MPGSPTTPGRAGTRDGAPVRVSFLLVTSSAPDIYSFAAQWLAYVLPYRRFADTLAMSTHGSGPMWIATPSSWGTFTSYSLPVLIGAPEEQDYPAPSTGSGGPSAAPGRWRRAISAPPQPTFLAPSARKRARILWGERRGNGTIVAVSKPTGVPHATGQ